VLASDWQAWNDCRLNVEHEFWHERWRSGRIGFHRSDVHPFLRRHFTRLGIRPGDAMFVPLCGKTVDMVWLREQGARVDGVEISPVAVEAFFSESGFAVTESTIEAFRMFEGEGIRLYCGDFFDLKREIIGDCHAVYDRAALIAFPEEQRKSYIRHLMKVVQPDTPILLITLEYPQAQMEGPPFAVTHGEIEHLFGSAYTIEVLERVDALGESQHLREKGLQSLTESALLLTPK